MKESDYIRVAITKSMKEVARWKTDCVRYSRKRGLNKFGSEKERTFCGFIGEQMVVKHLGIPVVDKYNYDLVVDGLRLEVKTIGCSFRPHTHYLCTVNSCKNEGVHQQEADYYFFTRVLKDYSVGWLLGYIKCCEFFEQGRFIKMGEQLIEGFLAEKANATVLEIDKLTKFKKKEPF